MIRNPKLREDIEIGLNVNIVLKQDQRSGKLTKGGLIIEGTAGKRGSIINIL